MTVAALERETSIRDLDVKLDILHGKLLGLFARFSGSQKLIEGSLGQDSRAIGFRIERFGEDSPFVRFSISSQAEELENGLLIWSLVETGQAIKIAQYDIGRSAEDTTVRTYGVRPIVLDVVLNQVFGTPYRVEELREVNGSDPENAVLLDTLIENEFFTNIGKTGRTTLDFINEKLREGIK